MYFNYETCKKNYWECIYNHFYLEHTGKKLTSEFILTERKQTAVAD